MAAGTGALATHDRSYVWNAGASPMASNGTGQFVVNAPGGVGINTNLTGSNALSVNGSASVSGGLAVAGAFSSGNLRLQRVFSQVVSDDPVTLASATVTSTGGAYLILTSVECFTDQSLTTTSLQLMVGGIPRQHRTIRDDIHQSTSMMWLENLAPGTHTIILNGDGYNSSGVVTPSTSCKGTLIVIQL
jgi:hypothetical protein